MKTKMVTAILLTLFLVSMLSMAFNVFPATAAISGTNVKGYWHFDEGAGDIAYDSSDYANDGILSGGKFGNALEFDGVDDYVDTTDSPLLRITGSMTIEAWVKFDTVSKYAAIVSKMGGGNARSYELTVSPTGIPGIYIASDPSTLVVRSATTECDDNKRHHIAGVYNADSQTLDMYVDGQLDNGILSDYPPTTPPTPVPSSQYSDNGLSVTIGTRSAYKTMISESKFKGIIDEVRLSNIARAPPFDLTVAPSVDAYTVALWHFDEGTGTTAGDASGNANHGTIHGATWTGTPPTWVEGKYGMALQFDGVDDYVDCGNDASLDVTNAITLEAWIYLDSWSGLWDRVVAKTASGALSYILGISATYRGVYFGLFKDTAQTYITGQTAIPMNTWTHIAGTWDGSTMKIYINGVEQPEMKSFSGPITVTTTHLYIGWDEYGKETVERYQFEGIIDEVRIWDIALPPEVVAVAATGTMEYLDIAGIVMFTPVFHDLTDGSTVTVYILPFDPSVSIKSTDPIYVHRVTPKRTGDGAYAPDSDLEGYSVDVTAYFGAPPCKTIHLWLYLSTGEHIGVNLQHAR